MNSRWIRLIVAIAVVLLFCNAGFAQQTTEKRWYAASLDGTTGLFKTWDAETLKQGETNWTFGYDLFTRDPGDIRVGKATAGVAIGIWDRLEVFEETDVQRHVTAGNISIYRVLPGQLSKPAQTPIIAPNPLPRLLLSSMFPAQPAEAIRTLASNSISWEKAVEIPSAWLSQVLEHCRDNAAQQVSIEAYHPGHIREDSHYSFPRLQRTFAISYELGYQFL